MDLAANDPITRHTNVAYTLHFYAGTHEQRLRDKATSALSRGLALFVTEWGTCEASGDGRLDLAESQAWIDFMNSNHLSWCNWSLFDKPEAASALRPGSSTSGGWPDSALTDSGRFVKQRIAAGLPGQLSGVVALKAAVNGRFVCAEDAGNAPLVANRSSAQRWEEFEVVSNSGGAPVPASLSTSYGKNPGKCSGR